MELIQVQDKSTSRFPSSNHALMIWYFAFFVVSGFCGLLYEVVWARLAMASFGVTTALTSIVISMFMAGLGFGSWGAGKVARRSFHANGPKALRYYAAIEFLIGVSSLAVPYEMHLGRQLLLHAGSFGVWQSWSYYLLAAIWIGITLFPWCTCMGATFPVLMTVIRITAPLSSQRAFSYLYIANVLGALIGTLASAFLLIELLGFHGTLLVAGTMNALLALLAFALSLRVSTASSPPLPADPPEHHLKLYGLPGSFALLFLFTSGLVSMGLEVIWIRQFTPYLGNVVYTFAAILAVYLLATVIGSQDYRSRINTGKNAEKASTWGLLALSSLLPVVAANPSLSRGLHDYNGVRLASILFFCALTGYLTPLLVDFWSNGDPDRAGTAYAINICGSILGPLLAGFGLLPSLGERHSSFVLSIPLFAIAGIVMLRKQRETALQRAIFNPKIQFAAIVILAIFLSSQSHDFETRFPEREVLRDYTATVIATGQGFDRHLLVNGIGMTDLTPITKYMAHLPLAYMSRPPRNGLVICFGMGTSFRAMLSWGIPTTVVDLVPSVPPLMGYFHADAANLLHSPLSRVVIDDGRRFLDGSHQSYDVIVVDPPPPPAAAGSSLLYSREFYATLKRHLNKGGILQMWYLQNSGDTATMVAVTKALQDAFPYVRAFRSIQDFGIHYLASMDPLPPLTSQELVARMPPAAIRDFVEWGPEFNPQKQLDLVISQQLSLPDIIATDPAIPAITDDDPVNEYYILRHLNLAAK